MQSKINYPQNGISQDAVGHYRVVRPHVALESILANPNGRGL